jgi:hypothetical protein
LLIESDYIRRPVLDSCALNCNYWSALHLCNCKIKPQTTQDRDSLITATCISSKANGKNKQVRRPQFLDTRPGAGARAYPCLALAKFKKPLKQEVRAYHLLKPIPALAFRANAVFATVHNIVSWYVHFTRRFPRLTSHILSGPPGLPLNPCPAAVALQACKVAFASPLNPFLRLHLNSVINVNMPTSTWRVC